MEKDFETMPSNKYIDEALEESEQSQKLCQEDESGLKVCYTVKKCSTDKTIRENPDLEMFHTQNIMMTFDNQEAYTYVNNMNAYADMNDEKVFYYVIESLDVKKELHPHR